MYDEQDKSITVLIPQLGKSVKSAFWERFANKTVAGEPKFAV
jgi:hypothetical protein